MANKITNVKMPASVVSGHEFDVTVEYTADEDGDLRIRYAGSFEGDPPKVSLDHSEISKTFQMTIARHGTAEACRVEFRFGNLWPCTVEVT